MNRWNEQEIDWLIQNYSHTGKLESARVLGRSEASIRQKASKLNLKKNRDSEFFLGWQARAAKSKIGKKRPEQAEVLKKTHKEGKLIKNIAQKAAVGKRVKEWIKLNGHPQGMLGKKHTEKTLKVISESACKMWGNPESKVNSEGHRQKLSDKMMENQRKGILRKGYSRGLQGKRDDLGNIFFRSSWEANFARYLNYLISKKIIYKWEFEPDTFWFENIKRGVRSYLPDFKIWDFEDSDPYYVEVKGWMDSKSKTKIKRMAKYYPEIRLDIVAKKEYTEIKKKLSRLIAGWE